MALQTQSLANSWPRAGQDPTPAALAHPFLPDRIIFGRSRSGETATPFSPPTVRPSECDLSTRTIARSGPLVLTGQDGPFAARSRFCLWGYLLHHRSRAHCHRASRDPRVHSGQRDYGQRGSLLRDTFSGFRGGHCMVQLRSASPAPSFRRAPSYFFRWRGGPVDFLDHDRTAERPFRNPGLA